MSALLGSVREREEKGSLCGSLVLDVVLLGIHVDYMDWGEGVSTLEVGSRGCGVCGVNKGVGGREKSSNAKFLCKNNEERFVYTTMMCEGGGGTRLVYKMQSNLLKTSSGKNRRVFGGKYCQEVSTVE